VAYAEHSYIHIIFLHHILKFAGNSFFLNTDTNFLNAHQTTTYTFFVFMSMSHLFIFLSLCKSNFRNSVLIVHTLFNLLPISPFYWWIKLGFTVLLNVAPTLRQAMKKSKAGQSNVLCNLLIAEHKLYGFHGYFMESLFLFLETAYELLLWERVRWTIFKKCPLYCNEGE